MVGDIAHVFNRGVEKRKIFLDDKDYLRFTSNLFLLNNRSGKIRTRRENIFNIENKAKIEKLVEILKWSLLPNHYHILIYEKIEGGILEFTKRLGNAYTKYFNTKNEGRSGYLFQNSARAVLMENNKQFLFIPFYIDLNPLDLKYPNWEEQSLDTNRAIDFLYSYEWSSFRDSLDGGERELIINKNMFYDLFDTNPKQYKSELVDFLSAPNRVDLPG